MVFFVEFKGSLHCVGCRFFRPGVDMVKYEGKSWIAEFLHNRTYAAIKDNGKKESRLETIRRTKDMHLKKFPDLKELINTAFSLVEQGKAVPSMRSLQFGGGAIERVNARIYNCAYAALTKWEDFHDGFYLLMCGTGYGYSVRKEHVGQLPTVPLEGENESEFKFVISDDKEGWAESLLALFHDPWVEFSYDLIRPKGSLISSGGTASGPDALSKTHDAMRKILQKASGRQLTPLECHDIMCHIADGVVVGGVRRAALICLFDADDQEMMDCKKGEWYLDNAQRARSNNSAVIYRHSDIADDDIRIALDNMFDSGSGEPGISLSNSSDMGFNPCHEIALRDGGLCNLTEINLKACNSLGAVHDAVVAATTIGTLQAAYTDFPVLQDKWTRNARQEALLGVSATGQADNWKLWQEFLTNVDVRSLVVSTNAYIAGRIGISPAARITTTKPSGSTSAWLGCCSGIHADHAPLYIRHIRMEKDHPIVNAVQSSNYPFIEVDQVDPDKLVIGFPVKASPTAILKNNETAVELMERAKFVYENWVKAGHISGENTHNVSLTVEYQDHEKGTIKDWMVENKNSYAGISFLPRIDSVYAQMPFQEIDEKTYNEMVAKITQEIDYGSVDWTGAVDERMGELACVNGACEIE